VNANQIVRLKSALADVGMGLWPRTDAPFALDIGEAAVPGMLRVSPIGFQPNEGDTKPTWLWIDAGRLRAVLEAFLGLQGDSANVEAFADEAHACAVWRMLSAEAGNNVHLSGLSTCSCWGCSRERARFAPQAVPAEAAR
jgi:hypothetical protein